MLPSTFYRIQTPQARARKCRTHPDCPAVRPRVEGIAQPHEIATVPKIPPTIAAEVLALENLEVNEEVEAEVEDRDKDKSGTILPLQAPALQKQPQRGALEDHLEAASVLA